MCVGVGWVRLGGCSHCSCICMGEGVGGVESDVHCSLTKCRGSLRAAAFDDDQRARMINLPAGGEGRLSRR